MCAMKSPREGAHAPCGLNVLDERSHIGPSLGWKAVAAVAYRDAETTDLAEVCLLR